ncbi:hypothetical protein AI3057V1_2488 [Citrobacter freundii]|nr:hypothetical protein AI3057V1_2488 [Citrobacter freundii]CAH6084759.1 hypothetical protein AI3057V1_2488 [Citrobacter freundii]
MFRPNQGFILKRAKQNPGKLPGKLPNSNQ